jgi:hypothetical protein
VVRPIIVWDLPDDEQGNVAHIAPTGISQDEVESVLCNPRNEVDQSSSTGEMVTFGWTETGMHIIVVWEECCEDPRMIYPITAYPVPPRQGRKRT